MIASIRGQVLAVRLDSAVVEVGGVGLAVLAAPSTLTGLRVGREASLSTSLVVREDSLTLYGFSDDEERDVFETVQTVSGIGPRLALALVAVLSPDRLRQAVAQEDYAALRAVPGVGLKSAQRIVLELRDKLGPPRGVEPMTQSDSDRRAEVVAALVGLGWPVKAAQDAVAQVVRDSAPIGQADVAEVLRAALRTLGGTRG